MASIARYTSKRLASPFCSSQSLFSSLPSTSKSHQQQLIRRQCRRSFGLLSRPVQIYRSTVTNPYINLSIEDYLLRKSHPDSTVLFLYVNSPCVVIGRNQNPWYEVNLAQVKQGISKSGVYDDRPFSVASKVITDTVPVSLVRRRSGGGTVFHDEGNVNWSVICPSAVFDRDRHAEMVVRALKKIIRNPNMTPRVNERHDIVVDIKGVPRPFTPLGFETETKAFKVSGSAYKVTRVRSLHHGTCLLSSPHLKEMGRLLKSPARHFIKARGVESVRSEVCNVGLEVPDFKDAVVAEFKAMYAGGERVVEHIVDRSEMEVKDIVEGVKQLTSPEWIYNQTPQFELDTAGYTTLGQNPDEESPFYRAPPPEERSFFHEPPEDFKAHLVVRHGEILEATLEDLSDPSSKPILAGAMRGVVVHKVRSWHQVMHDAFIPLTWKLTAGARWLNHMFGTAIPTVGLADVRAVLPPKADWKDDDVLIKKKPGGK
ncbi:hypothetical protein B0H63DRAFT_469738 [Podospora didyma]|uniref:Putative lipoate-protein ligase A n=1 Tax=Podospora didyma TaxID=330526 RepID=A0AAE0NTB3_9PEZI|nr:hypothetical protein B0H63DRAFT_469738 [Podospora didyma]